MKQVIIVRKDLKMSCGKIAGQVAHAAIRAMFSTDEGNVLNWVTEGIERKIVLKVYSEEELTDIIDNCTSLKLGCGVVRDAGLTQLEPGTLTAVGIGPYPDEVIDGIVGELKLL
jgi:PTH2 family peptidyl-tRNA hydrolase